MMVCVSSKQVIQVYISLKLKHENSEGSNFGSQIRGILHN